MKRIILLTVTLLITSFGYGQITKVKPAKTEEIGKISVFGSLIIDCVKVNNTFLFTYSDVKYTKIENYKTFEFKDVDGAFDTLYETIMDGFKNPPKEAIMIELPKGILFLSYVKMMGVTSFRFGHSLNDAGDVIGFSGYLTKKKVRKLFGKKK